MNSYDFEKVAKNATIKVLKEEFGINVNIKDMQVVWFTHCLGFKKCCLYAEDMGNKYAEVTYNRDKEEVYVDLYEKCVNVVFNSGDFDFNAN